MFNLFMIIFVFCVLSFCVAFFIFWRGETAKRYNAGAIILAILYGIALGFIYGAEVNALMSHCGVLFGGAVVFLISIVYIVVSTAVAFIIMGMTNTILLRKTRKTKQKNN